MQKPTLILLLFAVIAAAVGVLLVPQLLSEDEPVMQWRVEDEIDGEQPIPEAAEADTETGTLQRSEAAPIAPTAAIAPDDEDRVDAILRGRVVDKFAQPVAGANVWLELGRGRAGGNGRRGRGRTRRIPEPVVTDSEGRFAFQGQAFSRLRVSLQLQHERHAPTLIDQDVGQLTAAASAAAEIDLGDLVIKSGGLVRGRVTDLAGNGVPHATVSMEPDFRNRLRWQRNREQLLPSITTDASGYYSYPNVSAGDFATTAVARMHTRGRSERFTVEEDQTVDVADIVLGPGYELTGYVRTERGEPIAGAAVSLRVARGEAGGRGERGERGGRAGRGGRGRTAQRGRGRDNRTETDENGRFFVEHLPGSPHELRVDAKGFLTYEEQGLDPTLGRQVNVVDERGTAHHRRRATPRWLARHELRGSRRVAARTADTRRPQPVDGGDRQPHGGHFDRR